MTNSTPILMLLFHHPDHRDQALNLKAKIEALGSITVCLYDIYSKIECRIIDEMHGVVVLFSPALEKDPNLFTIVQAMQSKPQLERFFILSQTDLAGRAAFPDIFHPLRAQQHHIFTYPHAQHNRIDLSAFQERLIETIKARLAFMTEPSQPAGLQTKPGILQRIKAFWHGPRKTIVTVSLMFLLIFSVLAYFLFPQFLYSLRTLQAPRWIGFQAPALTSVWLDEPFDVLDTAHWQFTNRYEGRVSLIPSIEADGLSVQADSSTQHALYRIAGLVAYPLNHLLGFEGSFRLDALPETAGQAEIIFRIELADDEDFQLGCRAVPSDQMGEVSCFIQEPKKVVRVAAPQGISLEEPHTLSVEFIPDTYVARFYLDGDYFGRAPVSSVSLWQGKDFIPVVQVEVWDVTGDDFSCQVDHFKLAYQP